MIDRRVLLKGAAGFLLGGTGLGSYSVVVEPNLLLDVTHYRVEPAGWPENLRLRIAVISDLHACEPWMPVSRIRQIAQVANALAPDLTVLLGDFSGGTRFASPVMPDEWGEALSSLKAPLGVYAVLGNHDWWHGPLPDTASDDAEAVRRALKAMGAEVLENDAVRIENGGKPFWLLGLGDQLAIPARGRGRRFLGVDDLPATLAKVVDDAPAILLAHEPNVFARTPARIALTLSGHTHGGQVNLPFVGPVFAESRFETTHVYGHIIEHDRHLVISGGLGMSLLPVRFLCPPEIVEVTVAPSAVASAPPV